VNFFKPQKPRRPVPLTAAQRAEIIAKHYREQFPSLPEETALMLAQQTLADFRRLFEVSK
jgi:hypothetical protein